MYYSEANLLDEFLNEVMKNEIQWTKSEVENDHSHNSLS